MWCVASSPKLILFRFFPVSKCSTSAPNKYLRLLQSYVTLSALASLRSSFECPNSSWSWSSFSVHHRPSSWESLCNMIRVLSLLYQSPVLVTQRPSHFFRHQKVQVQNTRIKLAPFCRSLLSIHSHSSVVSSESISLASNDLRAAWLIYITY